MGNFKFRLSDMMPNAWFYKLRDMSKTRNQKPSHHQIKKKLPPSNPTSHLPHNSHPRPSSYYYHIPESNRSAADKFHNSPKNPKYSDTQFSGLPRKSSSKKKHKRKTIYKPSPRLPTSSLSANFSSSSEESSPEFGPKGSQDSHSSNGSLPSWSTSCNCRITSSTTDIIIDINEDSHSKKIEDKKIDMFDHFPQLQQLPPILTKPKVACASPGFVEDPIKIIKEDTIKAQKENRTSPRTRKSVSYSNGVKLRGNSPRIGSKKLVQSSGRRSGSYGKRRSFSTSLAVVKSSFDPQRDFRESMVEMIVENNVRASKDLEELLACYLSLNSDEYHDLIVKAFQQIWFDMDQLRL